MPPLDLSPRRRLSPHRLGLLAAHPASGPHHARPHAHRRPRIHVLQADLRCGHHIRRRRYSRTARCDRRRISHRRLRWRARVVCRARAPQSAMRPRRCHKPGAAMRQRPQPLHQRRLSTASRSARPFRMRRQHSHAHLRRCSLCKGRPARQLKHQHWSQRRHQATARLRSLSRVSPFGRCRRRQSGRLTSRR